MGSATFYEKSEEHQPGKKSSMVKREYMNESYSRSERRLTDVSDSDVQREPDPDYSPKLLRRKVPSSPDVRSSPSVDTLRRKKVYQKTRFSAEIPMIKRPKPTTSPPPPPIDRKFGNSIGETIRKFVGKLQGNGNTERKSQARNGINGQNGHHTTSNGISHQSSLKNHQQNQLGSYQTFNNNVDHHIISTDIESAADVGDTTDRSGRDSPSLFKPKQAVMYASSSASYDQNGGTRAVTTGSNSSTMTKKYVTTSSPTRRPLLMNGGSQTLDGNYRSSYKRHEDVGSKRASPVYKYYPADDPLVNTSHDHNSTTKPFRRKYKNGNSTDDEKKSIKTHFMNGVQNLLGSKLSKSNGKLASNSDSNRAPRVRNINIDYTDREVQTLPRKSKKQVFINDPASDQENLFSKRTGTMYHQSPGSMINVSVVNNHSPSSIRNGGRHYSSSFNSSSSQLLGPPKPARTYRSSLLRSHSFNVHSNPDYSSYDSTFKSNPQLHKLDKLDESPPPLKSPGIVTSVNRSTRDLSKFASDDTTLTNSFPSSRTSHFSNGGLFKTLRDDDFIAPSSLRNKHKSLDYSKSFHGSTNTTPRKPTVSFESDRHSNLNKTYTTLGRHYLPSDRNGINREDRSNEVVHRNVSRTGNNDDYSETVRITSKSSNPLRPSVTNTVKNFSKKLQPSKDGRMERIESSETTKVTKSNFRGDSPGDTNYRPSSRTGGINIEIKNEMN